VGEEVSVGLQHFQDLSPTQTPATIVHTDCTPTLSFIVK